MCHMLANRAELSKIKVKKITGKQEELLGIYKKRWDTSLDIISWDKSKIVYKDSAKEDSNSELTKER